MWTPITILQLLLFLRPTQSLIECEIRTDENNKFSFSEYLLANLQYKNNNTRESMRNLECFCNDSNDPRENLIMTTFYNDLDKSIADWDKAQNFIIRDCDELTLDLLHDRINWQGNKKYFGGGIIHIYNVRQLELSNFQLRLDVPKNEIAGVVFKNVGFDKSVKQLDFTNMVEVRLNNITVSRGLKNVEIKMTSNALYKGIESQLIVENSDFRTGSLGLRDTSFYFTFSNIIMLANQCLAQTGTFIMNNNHFDNFADETVMMTRGREFEFSNNKIEVLQERSIQIKNVKKVLFINNFLGVPRNEAIQILSFKQPNSCKNNIKPVNEIEEVTFNNNKMSKSTMDFLRVNIDGEFKPKDTLQKFKVTNNVILVPCNCQSLSKNNSKSSLLNLISNKFIRTAECFSNEGLVGKRASICSGEDPPKPEELLQKKETEVKSQYVTYIIVGTIVGFLVGAIIGAGVLFMCFGDKGAITPRETPSR